MSFEQWVQMFMPWALGPKPGQTCCLPLGAALCRWPHRLAVMARIDTVFSMFINHLANPIDQFLVPIARSAGNLGLPRMGRVSGLDVG